MKHYLIPFIIFIFLSSCAYVISKDNREIAYKDLAFKEILDNTESYVNNVFILGGIIAETANTKDGTEIEIVQSPIDRYGRIIDRDISDGRFLVTTLKRLDPLIFKKGRNITLAGKLIGIRRKFLGDLEYNYPLFEAKEIYLWKEERYYRPYSLIHDPYYYYPFYPYYYSYPYYWYDPFWRRPFIHSY